MIVILGFIVVIGAVLGGFSWAGGHVGALIHPSEVFTIGGASLGALIIMSPRKVLVDLGKGLLGVFKGSPYGKEMYREMFQVSYDMLRTARRNGTLVLEAHINDPHHSEIINRYPRFAKDHHAVDFLCGGLGPLVEGAPPERIADLLETQLNVLSEEHHAPIDVLSKTADALPGFGIVAAVLGIVITMGAIDGPVEEVGHKVGAALVGTFLGILMSYGFLAPLAARMEFQGHSELTFFRTISIIVREFAKGSSPKSALECARRGIGREHRPEFAELEKLFKEMDATVPIAA